MLLHSSFLRLFSPILWYSRKLPLFVWVFHTVTGIEEKTFKENRQVSMKNANHWRTGVWPTTAFAFNWTGTQVNTPLNWTMWTIPIPCQSTCLPWSPDASLCQTMWSSYTLLPPCLFGFCFVPTICQVGLLLLLDLWILSQILSLNFLSVTGRSHKFSCYYFLTKFEFDCLLLVFLLSVIFLHHFFPWLFFFYQFLLYHIPLLAFPSPPLVIHGPIPSSA